MREKEAPTGPRKARPVDRLRAYSRFCQGMTRFAKDVTGVTAHTRRAVYDATIKICRNGRPGRAR